MATRSRKGCIDCKQAKVKCDEVHPACGTCARRSRKCRGYLDTSNKDRASSGASSLGGTSRPAGIAPLQPLAQMPRRDSRSSSSSSHSYARPSLYMPYGRPPARASMASTMASPMASTMASTIVVAPEPSAGSHCYDDPLHDGRPLDIPWAPIEWQGRTTVSSPHYADSPYQHHQHLHQPASPYPGSLYPPSPYTSLSHAPRTPAVVIPDLTLTPLTPLTQPVYRPSAASTPSSSSSIHNLLDDDKNDAAEDELLSPPGAAAAHHHTAHTAHTPTTPGGRPLVGPDDRQLLGPAAAALSTSPVLEVSRLWSPPTPAPLRGPSFMPLNEILAADKPFIEIYFMRHPTEMVMSSSFFINEMNGAVLSLLQVSPIVVGDSLCAIGENYIKEMTGATGGDVVSHRKTRLLSRLRLLNEDGSSPELVLLLLLALCGAELTNPKSDGKGSSLPALIENVALILEFHTRAGHEISTTAKYFAKGVARQDLLHSLSRMQRPKIQPSTWLDEYAVRHADRLLGLTATLTPILYKLAELAEDVQAILDNDAFYSGGQAQAQAQAQASSMASSMAAAAAAASATSDADDLLGDGASFFPESAAADDGDAAAHLYLTQRSNLVEREAAIRAQLLMWRPIHDCSLSIQTSRTLLLHAAAWRAAALLYLYRLFNRPGSSRDADQTALSMAYEVMMHIHGPAEDVKLSLWPLFVAACELDQPEDRALAAALFGSMCHARPIMTARRTKEFVMDQIWPARDRGDVWDWMQLTRNGASNVFMPL